MDFDNRKVYGDTSITDGLVYIYRVFFLTGPQGPGNFQGPELLAAPGKFQDPGYFQAPWKIPGGSLSPVRHAVPLRPRKFEVLKVDM